MEVLLTHKGRHHLSGLGTSFAELNDEPKYSVQAHHFPKVRWKTLIIWSLLQDLFLSILILIVLMGHQEFLPCLLLMFM
jgi:hypothetical protein